MMKWNWQLNSLQHFNGSLLHAIWRKKATTNKMSLHRNIRKILQPGNVRKLLSLYCLCEPHYFKILGHAYLCSIHWVWCSPIQ